MLPLTKPLQQSCKCKIIFSILLIYYQHAKTITIEDLQALRMIIWPH